MTKSRNILGKRKQWTADELALLTHLYPSTFSGTLARLFGCTLHQVYRRAHRVGLKKSVWFANSPMAQRMRNDHQIGKATRFKKGQAPHNKGKRGISTPGMVATQFKSGHTPKNRKPVGATRICCKDGYLLMKMKAGNAAWQHIHRIIWQRMHGKVPAGHMVTFIDGNKLNLNITNLTTISHRENVLRNSINRYGPEIASLSRLKGSITREINKQRKDHHE